MLKATVRVKRPYVDSYKANDATTYYDYSTIEDCRALAVDSIKKMVDEFRSNNVHIVDTFITTI